MSICFPTFQRSVSTTNSLFLMTTNFLKLICFHNSFYHLDTLASSIKRNTCWDQTSCDRIRMAGCWCQTWRFLKLVLAPILRSILQPSNAKFISSFPWILLRSLLNIDQFEVPWVFFTNFFHPQQRQFKRSSAMQEVIIVQPLRLPLVKQSPTL